MLAKKISSAQHPLIQRWVRLRKERSFREEEKAVLLVGNKALREFPFPIQTLIAVAPCDIPASQKVLVTEALFKKITGLEETDGVAGEVPLPLPSDVWGKNFLLILDQIGDPGNLGTLLRTAWALGWEGVVATPGTVDFFNDKALRAAKGATFRLPYRWASFEETVSHLQGKQVYIAAPSGIEVSSIPFSPPLALVLSHEGCGAREEWKGKKVGVPMQRGVESLNVAVAGSILLYTMRQNP